MSKQRQHKSANWFRRHLKDPFVQRAKAEGMRSRATFKLAELHEKEKLFAPGMRVVELGAAPGGWSQYVRPLLGRKGQLIAVDILAMQPIPDVTFIQGDFMEDEALEAIEFELANQEVDWVISDMAPNLSGHPAVDQPRMMNLCEAVLYFAQSHLSKEGGVLMKTFQGEGFEPLLTLLRQGFQRVKIIKPKASRVSSRELYILAKGPKVV